MKDELGIEICGENCKGDVIPNYDCPKCGQEKCGDDNCQYFSPKEKLLKERIKELQENNFTEEELNTLKDILQDYFRVYTTQHYRTQPLLNKIEQILKTQNKD